MLHILANLHTFPVNTAGWFANGWSHSDPHRPPLSGPREGHGDHGHGGEEHNAPSASDDNCGCKDGGECKCPPGECKCKTCDSGPHCGVDRALTAVCVLDENNDSGVWGVVTFTSNSKKEPTHVHAELEGLTPGPHGIHIHELGNLTNGCMSTKGHFNPFGLNHGGPDDDERHVGDLGNVVAGSDGRAVYDADDSHIRLGLRLFFVFPSTSMECSMTCFSQAVSIA